MTSIDIEVEQEIVAHDAVAVEVAVFDPDAKGTPRYETFNGVSRRDPSDEFDAELGYRLAYWRAVEAAVKKNLKRLDGQIRHNDNARLSKSRKKYSAGDNITTSLDYDDFDEWVFKLIEDMGSYQFDEPIDEYADDWCTECNCYSSDCYFDGYDPSFDEGEIDEAPTNLEALINVGEYIDDLIQGSPVLALSDAVSFVFDDKSFDIVIDILGQSYSAADIMGDVV